MIAEFDKTIADFGDGFDPERILADGLRNSAQAGQDTIDRVLPDDAPFPAAFGQIFAANNLASRLRQREQHLHHARLDDLFGTIVATDFA
jgi:hypothetical protein